MSYLQTVDCDELRIILSFEFEQHASPGDVEAFKAQLLDCENTVHGVEATGSFGLIIEVAAPDLAWYNTWLKGLAEPFSQVVSRCETTFVCKRFIRRRQDESAIWVPANGRLKRFETSLIDKITAEGDYVRVHSRGDSYLVHSTLHSVAERLNSREFLQIHRSAIVRRSFITELARDGTHWVARLRDGTAERVARSHVTEMLRETQLADA